MDEEQYMAFHQCRLTNFLTRGKPLFCDWLHLAIDHIDKKDIEVFSYVLRIILQKIIEQAVRSRNLILNPAPNPHPPHSNPESNIATINTNSNNINNIGSFHTTKGPLLEIK
jgi:hypothetical protein